MGEFDLDRAFRHDDPAHSSFLARVFGIFSEEIVRVWCRDERSNYCDRGRPTLHEPPKGYSTLDFALVPRGGGDVLVAEMKCELSLDNFKYLRLDDTEQVERHKREGKKDKKAFMRFLKLAEDAKAYKVKVPVKGKGELVAVGGTALVWGSVSEKGRESVRSKYGIDVVLSLEDMVNDLIEWQSKEYHEMIGSRETWVLGMCRSLTGELQQ
jgi:hypothetical protein